MKNTTTNIGKSFSAEWLKLKSTPAILLPILASLFIAFIVFIGHSIDIHSLCQFNRNPWLPYSNRAFAIFSIFIFCPFAILLIAAVIYVEQRANSWKYIYSLPLSRGQIYFSKLLIILCLVILSLLLLILFLVISAYLLSIRYPEFEFLFYAPPIAKMASKLSHLFIALLGVIGLQYLMGLFFKNFLIPTGIGISFFVLGIILSLTKNEVTLFFPYSYPAIVKDFGMVQSDYVSPVLGSIFTNVEIYSLFYFATFITIGYFYERMKNIT